MLVLEIWKLPTNGRCYGEENKNMLLRKEQNQLHYILPSAMQDTCELHSPPQII